MRSARLWAALASALLLAAAQPPAGAGSLAASVEVANVAPVVASVTLPATVEPTAGGTTSVSVTIVAEDANGANDIASVRVEVLRPNGATTHVPAAAASLASATGVRGTFTYTFAMQYFDEPALGNSTYKVKVVATDSRGLAGDNLAALAVFNYAELVALNLQAGAIDFGANLEPGSRSAVVPLGVENHGNVRLDVQLNGSDMAHASLNASIPVGRVSYSTESNMSGSRALSAAPATLETFDLERGQGSSKPLHWQLAVPSGSEQWVPSGSYAGTLSVAALKG